jgi:hypothetical protein
MVGAPAELGAVGSFAASLALIAIRIANKIMPAISLVQGDVPALYSINQGNGTSLVVESEEVDENDQQVGVSVMTVTMWIARWRAQGASGLENRSSRPCTATIRLPEATCPAKVPRHGSVRVGRLMADNDSCYVSKLFRKPAGITNVGD